MDITTSLEYFIVGHDEGEVIPETCNASCCEKYNRCSKFKQRNKTISQYIMDGKDITDDNRDCYIASANVLSLKIKSDEEFEKFKKEIATCKHFTTIPSSKGNEHEFLICIIKKLFPNLKHIKVFDANPGNSLKELGKKDREKELQDRNINVINSECFQTILLVDDITTTGASMKVYIDLLKKEGKQVVPYAIAKTKS